MAPECSKTRLRASISQTQAGAAYAAPPTAATWASPIHLETPFLKSLILTGKIRCGREGPVAIETQLGWILSGPIFNCDQETLSTGLMTYALRIDALCPETQKLDDTLKLFWELESFGVPFTDKSLYDELCEKIKLRDGRYEVSLP